MKQAAKPARRKPAKKQLSNKDREIKHLLKSTTHRQVRPKKQGAASALILPLEIPVHHRKLLPEVAFHREREAMLDVTHPEDRRIRREWQAPSILTWRGG